MKNFHLLCSLAVFLLWGCSANEGGDTKVNPDNSRLLFQQMEYPNISRLDGIYYFIGQNSDIKIYKAESIDSLGAVTPYTVWEGPGNGMHNIWSPEMARVGNKWYIYFEADDGNNTDNHQLYVLENPSADPTEGNWTLHGPIITDSEWNFGLHPSTFTVNGRQYLTWSGWEHRRSEIETQCIFIAEMENPWTLKSPRVLISRPELEWERQWINPDGTRSAYPIFVNENPEPILSPDGKKVVIAYSASGIWTPYATIGMLYADTSSDLLNPASWTKLNEPQSNPTNIEGEMTAISNISTLPAGSDGKSHLFFQVRDATDQKAPRVYVKEFGWNADGIPEFGLKQK